MYSHRHCDAIFSIRRVFDAIPESSGPSTNHGPDQASHAQQLFTLTVVSPAGHTQFSYWQTHVPAELQGALQSGDAAEVVVTALVPDGYAARALPGAPMYLVRAVKTKSGELLASYPCELSRLRRVTRAGAVALAGLGVTALVTGWAVVGAIAWSLAVLTASREIPSRLVAYRYDSRPAGMATR